LTHEGKVIASKETTEAAFDKPIGKKAELQALQQ
jgi:hypothetical protein